MTMIGRRWLIAFALALAAHTTIFCFAGSWLCASPRPLAPEIALGSEALELTLVPEGPPAVAAAPALPAPVPPPVVPPPERPAEKPPEPVKEPEPLPVPEPKPVLTEPESVQPAPAPVAPPEMPVAPVAPVVRVDKTDVVDKMDGKQDSAPNAVGGGNEGGEAVQASEPRSDGLSSGSAPVSTIHPRYPMGSRIRGEEGPVLVRARVDDRGRPVEVTVLRSSGFLALDAAAVKAVKGARFVPPGHGAAPEAYLAELTIRFQLKDL